MKGDPYEENIPNTFAPRTKNKMFSIDMIIHGLRFGFLQMDSLPTDIRKKVNDVLESRKPRKEDIRKEDIPREFVNPNLAREKISIWDIVQLIGHGAVDFSLMPKEIRDRVDAELDRRGKLWRNTMSRSQHSEIVNPKTEECV